MVKEEDFWLTIDDGIKSYTLGVGFEHKSDQISGSIYLWYCNFDYGYLLTNGKLFYQTTHSANLIHLNAKEYEKVKEYVGRITGLDVSNV